MISRLVDKMLKGDRRALSRLFSLLERDAESLSAVMRAVYPHRGGAYCIGITGPPGAGKSTIVDGLVKILRQQGKAVGVLAVDPTSPFSGGAVLGDRIRMQRHFLDEGVFIRSMATRGVSGGVSRGARASVKLMDTYGMDMIIVETVGVGQTELDITKVADTVVVTLVPEGGDAVQAMKAGLMEIGDIFVVNKADRVGAGRLVAIIKAMVGIGGGESWWRPPILTTQAHKGEGIQALYDGVLQHRQAMETTSNLERRRSQRQAQEFAQTLKEAVEAGIAGLISQEDGPLSAIAAQVRKGELDPYSAAERLLEDDLFFSQLARALGDSRGR